MAAPSDEAIRQLQRDDPAIRAGIGMRYETLPMPKIVVGRPPPGAAPHDCRQLTDERTCRHDRLAAIVAAERA